MTERDYDPKLDVTAGELRARGIQGIPEDVPDCAWVPRSSLSFDGARAKSIGPGGTLNVDIELTFKVPFRWIEVTVKISS